ncbi:double-strand break repair protein AddB [Croceibacterium ferulae]|uniref:double-strand break repair protein AddB n=1 Tax=Croceibacterium ferulae TaxID=1854641 RepID=UPI001F4D50F4|nr:double-strand break repair protein AddB [Croceibacterium ferulae]
MSQESIGGGLSRGAPRVHAITAHRGFADALVAGLVPRYSDTELGLARLTLLLPSTRAIRTVTEAFIRHFGEHGGRKAADGQRRAGLLLPRMVVVGDLDLDEALGPVLDPLAAGADIPPAADPTYRWLRLAELIAGERPGLPGAALLRLAHETARTMDRLLVEEIAPEDLLGDLVLDTLGDLAEHWRKSLALFARVQQMWRFELEERGQVDAATRRNLLFRHAAQSWRRDPPATPIIAAGVTSAAPALARLLRVVSELPQGGVVLPDFDLALPEHVWDELGHAGAPDAVPPLAHGDAVTHPQYHLKVLLNRMGVGREEVQAWHRAGLGAAPPARSQALSSLFLPPSASRGWIDLPPEKRRMSGVRLMQTAHPEEEAQAIALLVREALEVPARRVAVVTPDRGLAGRVVDHLRRWNIQADDSAGRPLPQTAAGRLFLLLAQLGAEGAAPVPLIGLLQHPLMQADDPVTRARWLDHVRRLDLALRGPRRAPGLEAIGSVAQAARLDRWWDALAPTLTPVVQTGTAPLADLLDGLVTAGEVLAGEALWAREDGRALAEFVEDLRLHAGAVGTMLDVAELPAVLREAMERVAVRPSYGGHPRVTIYGLLESRMVRADLVICGGLNEGVWPATPSTDPLLAPAVLRALGVPGADFRIGLAAHDLAGALGAPEVVLSRAERDAGGPAIASRFWLRVQALLGEDLLPRHQELRIPELARLLDQTGYEPPHPRPQPSPSPEQRQVRISVTALDRLRSDPYQFYASSILRLKELQPLDAEPDAAWRGTAAHAILEAWHRSGRPLPDVAEEELAKFGQHPLMLALWRPRLLKALEWAAAEIARHPERAPALFEEWGEMVVRGVTIFGKVDRIDRLPGGELAIIDYKTGRTPSGAEVEAGYALQLGTLGLMARAGGFPELEGEPTAFEYWTLAKAKSSETGFGAVVTPLLVGSKRSGIPPADFLPEAERYLHDALSRWILGEEAFTARLNPDAPGYATYDQLMRLDEWMGEL